MTTRKNICICNSYIIKYLHFLLQSLLGTPRTYEMNKALWWTFKWALATVRRQGVLEYSISYLHTFHSSFGTYAQIDLPFVCTLKPQRHLGLAQTVDIYGIGALHYCVVRTHHSGLHEYIVVYVYGRWVSLAWGTPATYCVEWQMLSLWFFLLPPRKKWEFCVNALLRGCSSPL